MRFQLYSDLHLETRDYAPLEIPRSCSDLLLAGDIGNTKDSALFAFLTFQLSRFERVFFVLGNHEPYGSSYVCPSSMHGSVTFCKPDAIQALADFELANKGHFYFLNRQAVELDDDTVIVGCTLWSALDLQHLDLIRKFLPDFRNISGMTPELYDSLHQRDSAWLSKAVTDLYQQHPQKRIVVATHHAPTVEGTSAPEFAGSKAQSCFSTELSDQPWWKHVHTFIFGHTHYSQELVRHGVPVVSNQLGYINENTGFKLDFVVDLDSPTQ